MHIVAHARALYAEVICLTAAGNDFPSPHLFQRRRFRPRGCNARMALIMGVSPD